MGLEGEALFYRKRRSNYDPLVGTVSVGAGSAEIINNGEAIRAMGVVDILDTKATIKVKKAKNLEGILFRDSDDDDGVCVNLSKDIVLTDGQALLLTKRTRGGSREVILFYYASDDYDESVEDPDPTHNVPVLV